MSTGSVKPTVKRDRDLAGKPEEAYVWMRLLQHGMLPCLPLVDCRGFDALVRLTDARCVRLQVKSRGEPLPATGGYGEQIKSLWWTEGVLGFDYLVIVLRLEGEDGYQAWVVPADVIQPRLKSRGDLTLSRKLLRVDWARYRECWNLD